MSDNQEGSHAQDELNPALTDQPEAEARQASRPPVSESPPRYLLASKTEFRGPLPPPEALRAYDDIVPGAAERLLTEAERNGEHRRWRERTALQAQVARVKWGLAAGFSVAMSFLAVSGALIAQGHDVSGTILGTVDLVALVGVFVVRQFQAGGQREGTATREGKDNPRLEAAPPPDKPA